MPGPARKRKGLSAKLQNLLQRTPSSSSGSEQEKKNGSTRYSSTKKKVPRNANQYQPQRRVLSPKQFVSPGPVLDRPKQTSLVDYFMTKKKRTKQENNLDDDSSSRRYTADLMAQCSSQMQESNGFGHGQFSSHRYKVEPEFNNAPFVKNLELEGGISTSQRRLTGTMTASRTQRYERDSLNAYDRRDLDSKRIWDFHQEIDDSLNAANCSGMLQPHSMHQQSFSQRQDLSSMKASTAALQRMEIDNIESYLRETQQRDLIALGSGGLELNMKPYASMEGATGSYGLQMRPNNGGQPGISGYGGVAAVVAPRTPELEAGIVPGRSIGNYDANCSSHGLLSNRLSDGHSFSSSYAPLLDQSSASEEMRISPPSPPLIKGILKRKDDDASSSDDETSYASRSIRGIGGSSGPLSWDLGFRFDSPPTPPSRVNYHSNTQEDETDRGVSRKRRYVEI